MKYRFQALAATSLEWTLPNRHWAVRIMVDSWPAGMDWHARTL